MNNFQREGSTSNSHVGRAFEERARKALAEHGLRLESGHKVPCGLGPVRKNHAFDLGSGDPKVIVECKSHTWTSGGKRAERQDEELGRGHVLFLYGTAGLQEDLHRGAEPALRPVPSPLLTYFLRRTPT